MTDSLSDCSLKSTILSSEVSYTLWLSDCSLKSVFTSYTLRLSEYPLKSSILPFEVNIHQLHTVFEWLSLEASIHQLHTAVEWLSSEVIIHQLHTVSDWVTVLWSQYSPVTLQVSCTSRTFRLANKTTKYLQQMVSPEGSVSVDGVAICFMHCTLPILYYSHITQCPIALNFTCLLYTSDAADES